MGQYKNVGDMFLALAEECNEVSQVILKKYRFEGDWNEIPEGKDKSRKQMLKDEMEDLMYQWNRCLRYWDAEDREAEEEFEASVRWLKEKYGDNESL